MWARLFIFISLCRISDLHAAELLFTDAVELALAASRQIKISRIDHTLAKINTLQNAAMMSPKVSVIWNDTYYNSAITVPFGGQDISIRPKQLAAGSLVLQQPLSMLIGLLQKIRSDIKTQQAAETGLELTQVEIAFGTAQAYRQIQQLDGLVKIAKERIELGIRQEQDATENFKVGRISKSDLLRIHMALGQARVAASSIITQYETALLAFKDLLGYELTDSIELSKIPSELALKTEKEALSQERLDIRIAQLTFRAAQENNWLPIASFLPNLSAFARIDENFTNAGTFQIPTTYSFGFNLTWDIWDGGARLLNMKSTSLLASKAHLNLIETKRQALIDQEQKKLAFHTAKETLGLQKTTLEQAQEAYFATSEKFKYGAASITDLLQSELDLNNARINWNNAITDLDVKHMLLQKANGQKRPETLL